MADNLAIGIVIGGAVSSTLGAAISKTSGLIGGMKSKAEDARGLQSMIGQTQRLQREYRDAFMAGSKEAETLRKKINLQQTALKSAGIDIGNLEKSYVRLGRTMKSIEWQEAGANKMRAGSQLGKTAVAGLATAAIPTKISGDYQSEVRDIAIKAGVAGKGGEKELDAQIRAASARQKVSQTELARSINGLVTQGMDWKEATGYGDLLGELTVGQKMDAGDAAKLIYAFKENGVSATEMRKVMGEVAVAGDLGAFESDKMAKFMPELMASVGAMGMKGPEAVRYLAASLQAQIKLTGDADSAANNFKNLLAKIIAPDTTKKFKDAGINLEGSMAATMKEHGGGPVDAFIRLTEHLATTGNKERAAKIAELKAKVAASGDDKKAESEALSAYMSAAGLGEIMTDMQARTAALAQIKYGKQIKSDLDTIKKTDGGKKLAADKQLRDETSNRKWEVAASEFSSAMVSLGDAIRPVTDWAADASAGVMKLGTSLVANNPVIGLSAVTVGIGALGLAAGKFSLGATQWAAGKVLGRFGLKLPADAKGGTMDTLGKTLGASGSGGVQQVAVTNWPGGGTAGPDLGELGGKGKPSSKPAPSGGRGPRIGSAVKSVGSMLGRSAGSLLAVGMAGYQTYDTYKNAKTAEDKGKGYGGAGGTLAGGLAGAKLGAVIGTMIAPGIGTAVGSLIGGGIGAFGGEKVGAWIGKTVATSGSGDKPAAATADKTGKPLVPPAVAGLALPVIGATAMAMRQRGSTMPGSSFALGQTMSGKGLAGGNTLPGSSFAPGQALGGKGVAGGIAADVAGEVVKKLAERMLGGDKDAAKTPKEPAKPPVTQTFTYNPTIQVTVKGDVKDPRQIATEIAPHLRSIFDGWQQQARRAAMYDPVGA